MGDGRWAKEEQVLLFGCFRLDDNRLEHMEEDGHYQMSETLSKSKP